MPLLFLPRRLPHSPPHTHSLLLSLSGRGLEHRVPSAHFSHSPLRVSTSAPTTHTPTTHTHAHKPLGSNGNISMLLSVSPLVDCIFSSPAVCMSVRMLTCLFLSPLSSTAATCLPVRVRVCVCGELQRQG